MTLSDALRAADTGGPEFLPIRCRGWTAGLRIWYSRSAVRWWWTVDGEPSNLCDIPTQMLLTPATILADDWELVE